MTAGASEAFKCEPIQYAHAAATPDESARAS